MTDGPLGKLLRLVGGVALLPGPIGHQALGQLLISGSKAVEVAGANVALAAAFRRSNSAVQLAVGTIVPAAVVEVLSSKEERRLMAERQRLERMAGHLAGQPDAWNPLASLSLVPDLVVEALIRNDKRRLEQEQQEAETQNLQQQDRHALLGDEVAELKSRNERLERDMKDLQKRFDKDPKPPPGPKKRRTS